MKTLFSTIKWDLQLQARYNILTALWIVTGLYILLFSVLPAIHTDELISLLVFSDPALLGLTFIGALILFEKDDNTLQALVVTPIEPWQYLWSKALSLAIAALPPAILMAGFGYGWEINYLWLSLSVVLTSVLLTFFGIGLVAGAKNLNEFIIKMALWTFPIGLPLLNTFGLVESYIWYLIPTQGSLLLLEATTGSVMFWQLAYALVYLCIATFLAYKWAERSFERKIVRTA